MEFYNNPKRLKDLKNYPELRYLSNNENLKRIVVEIVDEVLEIDSHLEKVATYEAEIDDLLFFSKNFRGFDGFVKDHANAENFWLILKQLLKLNMSEMISRKTFQIAMGIQQVRWMADQDNTSMRDKGLETPEVEFFLYEDLAPHVQEAIQFFFVIPQPQVKICYNIPTYRLRRPEDKFDNIDQVLQETIWYKCELKEQGFGINAVYLDRDMKTQWFPIPETLNFSAFAFIHAPELVFGSLRSQTITNHIATFRRRPFAAHLPGSTRNIMQIDGRQAVPIVSHWIHDFLHMRTFDIVKDLDTLKEATSHIERSPWRNITKRSSPNEILQMPIVYDEDFEDRHKIDEVYESLNDIGIDFVKSSELPSYPIFLGGGKMRKKEHESRRRCRAASKPHSRHPRTKTTRMTKRKKKGP